MQIKYNKKIYDGTRAIKHAASRVDEKAPSEYFYDTKLDTADDYERLFSEIHELCVLMEGVIKMDVADLNKAFNTMFTCDNNISSQWKRS